MKTSQAVVILIIVAVLCAFAFIWSKQDVKPGTTNNNPTVSSIVGCYVAGTSKDVFTLHIQSQEDVNVAGTLAFNNFEKDSSHGTFSGTYDGTTLLGDYDFQSEGMESLMQVIFKRSGEDFVRGYGPVDNEGTSFTDLNDITYDASSVLNVFKKTECPS